MEAPFAMGLATKSWQQKKKEAKEKFRARIKERIRKDRLENAYLYYMLARCRSPDVHPFILKERRWFLLKGFSIHMDVFMYHAGDRFHEILSVIRRKFKRRQPEKYKALRAIAFKNQKVRWAFQALARLWIRRRFRVGNEEDLVTGSAPVNPIVLMDWLRRRRYVFEPQTIARDMIARLQMSYCTVFPKPRLPRNPYTNTDMTAGQFFSIVKQLRAVGTTHWTLEALYSVEYNMNVYEKEMDLKIRNTIMRDLFSNHNSIAGIDLILDFIKDEHSEHGIPCNHALYKWALEKLPLHPRIKAWRSLCQKYYKIANMVPPHPQAETISLESLYLCHAPHELERLQRLNRNNTANNPR